MDDLINELYVYCTDLVINLANIFYLSYYEINTIIFCIIYPVFLIGLSSIYLIQKRRLKKLEK
jgi:hypothetical protein